MKKITREETKVITIEVWVSVDGKEFNNEEDCKQWENSYKGTLSASWNLIKKEEINSGCFGIPYGCDDYECYLLKPSSLEEITLINAYINSETYNNCQTLTTDHINKLIVLNFGYDRDYCDVYTVEKHLERINNYINERADKLNGSEVNE